MKSPDPTEELSFTLTQRSDLASCSPFPASHARPRFRVAGPGGKLNERRRGERVLNGPNLLLVTCPKDSVPTRRDEQLHSRRKEHLVCPCAACTREENRQDQKESGGKHPLSSSPSVSQWPGNLRVGNVFISHPYAGLHMFYALMIMGRSEAARRLPSQEELGLAAKPGAPQDAGLLHRSAPGAGAARPGVPRPPHCRSQATGTHPSCLSPRPVSSSARRPAGACSPPRAPSPAAGGRRDYTSRPAPRRPPAAGAAGSRSAPGARSAGRRARGTACPSAPRATAGCCPATPNGQRRRLPRARPSPMSMAKHLAFSRLRKISSGGSVMLLSRLPCPLLPPPPRPPRAAILNALRSCPASSVCKYMRIYLHVNIGAAYIMLKSCATRPRP